jgi:hypothetical protein
MIDSPIPQAARSSAMVEVETIAEHEGKQVGQTYSVSARRAETLVLLGLVKVLPPAAEGA